MRKALAAVALSAAVLVGAAAPAIAADKTFIVVTSADPQTQAMAMILGHQAVDNGAEVRVLLCGPGGDMALKGAEMPVLKGPDKTPQQLLGGLIQRGATAEVCGIYLPNSTHTAADLMEGVAPVKPPVIGAYMAQPDVRYFTF